jgi:hypothetical protein
LALAVVPAVTADNSFNALVNADGSFGLALNVVEPLKEWTFGAESLNTRRLGYTVDAVFGSKLESLPNHLYADLNGSLEWFNCPGKNFVMDLALRGARIEATQDFRSTDFAAGAEIELMHTSLLNRLAGWLSPGAAQGANPSHLSLGYSYLAHIRQDTLGPGWNSRIDAELFLSLPVTQRLNLGFLGRWFNRPQDAVNLDTWKAMLEGVATFKLNDKWAYVKYQLGGLPPAFEPVDKWSLGVGFAFD